jgi:1,4-dihydroxy-2-naphthoyl-CoA hydrolase
VPRAPAPSIVQRWGLYPHLCTTVVGRPVKGEVVDPASLVAMMPFTEALDIEVVAAAADGVEGVLTWAPERCTTGGLLHGGALMSLADSLGGICAFLNLPEGAVTSTIESKTNFFRAVKAGRVTGTTKPVHVGRTTIVVQTEIRNDDGKLVALTTQTQAVIPLP